MIIDRINYNNYLVAHRLGKVFRVTIVRVRTYFCYDQPSLTILTGVNIKEFQGNIQVESDYDLLVSLNFNQSY